MNLPSGPAAETPGEPEAPPRQRWRLVLARSADAPELAGRQLADAWDEAIAASGLPLHRPSGQARTRVAWGAPLPLRMAAERELAEIVLTEIAPVWRVREALLRSLPTGWRLVDLHDVWLGSPALAGRVTGAVYRVTLDGDADPGSVAAAVAGLLKAGQLPRTKVKGGAPLTYDLRLLLDDVEIVQPGRPTVLRIRTRIHPERGSGRPEEVVAELADRLGLPLAIASIVRERLVVDDQPA